MSTIKSDYTKSISDKFVAFESDRKSLKNADFSDFKTFLNTFLNTPETKQRKKLSEEFKKRHMELYTFLKENAELVVAETDISRMINAAVNGEEQQAENTALTNLLEMIGESFDDV